MKISYAFIFGALLLFLGCQKEVILDNTDKNFPLRLNYSTTDIDAVFIIRCIRVYPMQEITIKSVTLDIPSPSDKYKLEG
jgi:hypothetical protein